VFVEGEEVFVKAAVRKEDKRGERRMRCGGLETGDCCI